MVPRRTRASLATAKSAEEPVQLSSPPKTPSPVKDGPRSKAKGKQGVQRKATENSKTAVVTPPNTSRKRKAAPPVEDEEEEEEQEEHELPHGLGDIRDLSKGSVKKGETAEAEKAKPAKRPRRSAWKSELDEKVNTKEKTPVKTTGKKGAKPNEVKKEESPSASPKKRAKKEKTETFIKTNGDETPKKKKEKVNKYGLTPGETPFPDWPRPTAEECQEVNDILSKKHGKVAKPAVIPAPSTTVSGCGEVPSVLDALIRTLLSAATTGANSSRAFKGLVDAFGLLQEGIGKGSVNWNRVREADVKEVFNAIKSGGLADNKSKYIKQILDKVYEENQLRREALVKQEDGKETIGPAGSTTNESEADKQAEIARAEANVLSLDHLHALPNEEAFNILTKYPGIGPKTASCVLLFCLQRPSFAVDTHVWRLCKYLGWVPLTANRNATYSHCEVRVPDDLKYALHQLLIRHGKACPRCRAATTTASEGWEKGCPIEHLVVRPERKKGGGGAGGLAKKQKRVEKGKAADDSESESESDDPSGVFSDDGQLEEENEDE